MKILTDKLQSLVSGNSDYEILVMTPSGQFFGVHRIEHQSKRNVKHEYCHLSHYMTCHLNLCLQVVFVLFLRFVSRLYDPRIAFSSLKEITIHRCSSVEFPALGNLQAGNDC